MNHSYRRKLTLFRLNKKTVSKRNRKKNKHSLNAVQRKNLSWINTQCVLFLI